MRIPGKVRRIVRSAAAARRSLLRNIACALLVVLCTAGTANAACYLHLSIAHLPLLKKLIDTSTSTIWHGAYTYYAQSPQCGIAYNWPVKVSVSVAGTWSKTFKTATERIQVNVSTQSAKAAYRGKTVQKCKADPWRYYSAGCPSFYTAFPFFGVGSNPNYGVTKTGSGKGWNGPYIPWNGFDYAGPFPASRPATDCCWFNPWWGF